jgi:hypothetical protein
MYVRGNPLRYTDPTGHCAFDDDGNITKFDCTVDDFQNLTWDQRKLWMSRFVQLYNLGNWFNDIMGAIGVLSSDADYSNMDGWAAYMDAGILQAINDGMNLRQGRAAVGAEGRHGGAGWEAFFAARQGGMEISNRNQLIVIRLDAEQQGVNYALSLPETDQRYDKESLRVQMKVDLFLWGADAYRSFGQWCRGNYSCDSPYTDPRVATETRFIKFLSGLPGGFSRGLEGQYLNSTVGGFGPHRYR